MHWAFLFACFFSVVHWLPLHVWRKTIWKPTQRTKYFFPSSTSFVTIPLQQLFHHNKPIQSKYNFAPQFHSVNFLNAYVLSTVTVQINQNKQAISFHHRLHTMYAKNPRPQTIATENRWIQHLFTISRPNWELLQSFTLWHLTRTDSS